MSVHTTGWNIDKNSPIPAHHQIYSNLFMHIENGTWADGEYLPSENKLMDIYSCSRVTVRQALATLEKSGFIRKEQGRGSAVSYQGPHFVHDFSLPSILHSKLGGKGINLDSKIIQLQEVPPVSSINNSLKLDLTQSLIYISRCFLYKSSPIAFNESWISASLIPGILEEGLIDNHLSATLENRYKLVPVCIDNTLETVYATSNDIIEYLQIPCYMSLLSVSSISYLADQTPLEFSQTLWRTDKVRFHFQVNQHTSDNEFNSSRP